MFGALWLITFKQWRAHRLRVALTTLGIALGVAVFFAIRTGNATLLDSLRATVEKLAGKATLQITAGESGFSEKVLDTVRATPGVQLAEPVIETMVQTSFADEGALLVLGVDTTGDQQLRDYQFDRTQTQIADPLVFLAQPNSILLSRAFADRHGLKVGDKLPLFASDGKKEFTVQGTFKPVGVGEVFGGNVAVMDVYSAQVVFHRGRKFDRIDLMNAPSVPVEVVQQRLRAQLPPGVEVDRPEVRGQALENAVTAMRMGILITSFVALAGGRVHHLQFLHHRRQPALERNRHPARRGRGAGKRQPHVFVRSAADGSDRFARGHRRRFLSGVGGQPGDARHGRGGLRSRVHGRAREAAPRSVRHRICAGSRRVHDWRVVSGARRGVPGPCAGVAQYRGAPPGIRAGVEADGRGRVADRRGLGSCVLDSVAPGLADSIRFRRDRSAGPDDCAAEAGAVVGARVAADHELGWEDRKARWPLTP